ncbi:MAG: glutathione S-transferase family protein [Deltaproteobacteria bacterium]|nr:glutathione S-transferase family protein [Deltaproteobacteria bacterium]
MASPRLALWGSELSPFALKVRACLDWAGLGYEWLPAEGGRLRNLRVNWMIERAKRARTVERHPRLDPLDEYPLVPFLVVDDRRVLYDSSALARWIDDCHPSAHGRLVPTDPAAAFVARLLDEAFDEFGLYIAHHNRWVVSATTNDAGARLAREFRRVLPPGTGWIMARRFAARQVRRLPYLFSVAPAGFSVGLRPALTPPAPAGFPPTHALLGEAWVGFLAALEPVLARRPYLLGAGFTIADAGVYGQLAMNLADPTAADDLRARAPRTFAWLQAVRARRHAGASGPPALPHDLAPLLDVVARTFVPLMRQNAHAYAATRGHGETLFNERAFDRGRALYDGTLLGRPFRAVVKTFQVRVWRELRAAWRALDADARARVGALVSPEPFDAG